MTELGPSRTDEPSGRVVLTLSPEPVPMVMSLAITLLYSLNWSAWRYRYMPHAMKSGSSTAAAMLTHL